VLADHAGDDGARVHADADGEIEALFTHQRREAVAHPDHHLGHGLGMVGPRLGQAGDGHVGVASGLDLLDAVVDGELIEEREDAVEQADEVLGVRRLGKLRESGEVAEQHGDGGEPVGDRALVGLEPLGDRRGQDVEQELLRLLPLGLEIAEGLVALEAAEKGVGVDAEPRDQLDLVGGLDQVVVGPGFEQLRLDVAPLHGGEHDHGHHRGGGERPVAADHLEAVDLVHDEVLEDDGGAEGLGDGHRRRGVGAELEDELRVGGEEAAEEGADELLVVDHEHAVGGRRRCSRPGGRGIGSGGRRG